MKKQVIILVATLGSAFTGVSAHATTATAGAVQTLLPNIVNRVTQCAIAPVLVDANGTKTMEALQSHCPEVKVLSSGVAKIKVDSHIFQASLVDSADSDGGDLDDVTITDVRSGETATFHNVLAFGDILLGVLSGDASHVYQQQVFGAQAATQ